jgi:RNA:NAD 2'-phosphotransferase (TPT1/KptA family)
MRQWMKLVEALERSLPKVLFHGTSQSAWEAIQETGTMMSMEREPGVYMDAAISFSESIRVAEEFARQAASNDMDEKGVVLYFDTDALAKAFELVAYHDPDISTSWAFDDEQEFRIPQPVVNGIAKFVTRTKIVYAESFDDPTEWRPSNWDIVRRAVGDLARVYAGKWQGACEGATADLVKILEYNHIPCQAVEGRYMEPMSHDGFEDDFTPHWWVETEQYILDPTRQQFKGPKSSELIIKKGSSDARMYQHGGVGQITESIEGSLLYHGTTTAKARSIIANGFIPRGKTNSFGKSISFSDKPVGTRHYDKGAVLVYRLRPGAKMINLQQFQRGGRGDAVAVEGSAEGAYDEREIAVFDPTAIQFVGWYNKMTKSVDPTEPVYPNGFYHNWNS